MNRKPAILPLFFLAFMVFCAARIGYAAFLAIDPHDAIEAWASGGGSAGRGGIEERMEEAHKLDPGNPLYLEDLVRLRSLRASPGQNAGKQELEKALPEIREAIRLRPVSPYSWSALLFVKSGLGEHDEEFSRALSNSNFLGPWEPEVQLVVADVGMANWAALSYLQREDVRKAIVRGMERQREKMIGIVMARKCVDSACR